MSRENQENDVDKILEEFMGSVTQYSWARRRFYVQVYEFCSILTVEEQNYFRGIWPSLMIRGLVDCSWIEITKIFKGIQKVKNQFNINSTERAVITYMAQRRNK